MFDFIHTSDDSHNTPFNSDSTHDAEPGYAAPPPDTGALLAAVGLPAHTIREVLASRAYTGVDG